jgi:hypothetical protein
MHHLLMSPISDIARRFDVRPQQLRAVEHVLIQLTLHVISVNECKAALKPLVNDAPAEVCERLQRMRYNLDLYQWKLAALAALAGDSSRLSAYDNGVGQLLDAKRSVGVNHPKVVQPLDYKAAEGLLAKAVQDIYPVIRSLLRKKLDFVERQHGNPHGMLNERAVMTFRWEYPFCRNPGATLNTAIVNYTNNIVRDASTLSRSKVDYDKGKGVRTPKEEPWDDALTLTLADKPQISDLQFDLQALPPFDQRVVTALLTEVDGANCQQRLAMLLGASEEKVGRAFGRIHKYLRGDKLLSRPRMRAFQY